LKNIKWLGLFTVCFWLAAHLVAANEIDIDTDTSNSSATATPAATVFPPMVELTATPVAVEETQEIPSPTPMVAQGILKMKDVYRAGISYYKKQDFAKAIRYLSKSLKVHDPYTPKFYYAEANAMLGVIYQFHIIDKKLAYQYYREALRIDPRTKTARKHIREVSGKKGSK
jgi:tetratricopeptide (TPR) repeat protein